MQAEFRGAYGSPRITGELKSRGIPISGDRVKRFMNANGIRVKHKRRYKATSDGKHALRMARFRRKPASGVLHHSDRGSQYCSHDYQALLIEYGMTCSMSRKGNCRDNATMESLFNSLKNEHVFHEDDETQEEVKQDLFKYIEMFYNRRRRHSASSHRSPARHYAAWIAEQKPAV